MNVQVKIGDQTFEVEVGDLSARPVLVKIEGDTFEVWPEEATPTAAPVVTQVPAARPAPAAVQRPATPAVHPAVAPIPAAAVQVGVENKSRVITAPIPGAIVSIH